MQTHRFRYFFYFAAAIGLYLFFSLMVMPIAARNTPLCGLCHQPRAAYETHKKSSHPNVGCLACHRSPGVTGAVAQDLIGWRNLITYLTARRPTERRVGNDLCLACHDDVLYGTSVSKRLRMRHREVIDTGRRCADCHGAAGHRLTPAKELLQTASMDKCFVCHSKEPALKRCRLCHVGGAPAKKPNSRARLGLAAHGPNWADRRHGLADEAICSSCHEETFCKRCHLIELPHPRTGWPDAHGTKAKAEPEACRRCHSERVCENCHQMAMPHPEGYAKKHGDFGPDTDVCLNCHVSNECAACHQTHSFHKSRKQSNG